MTEQLWEVFIWLVGGGGQEYDRVLVAQVIARTVVIYLIALAIIRIGKRRFMGNYSAFDILMGFIVGSITARGITGAIRPLDMVVVVSVLMALHWLTATVSFYWGGFGKLVENTPRKLIIDGEIQKKAMEKSKIGQGDLLQALRDKANLEAPNEVKVAYLERDGNITVVPKTREPKIIDSKVENGVQTIRIVIEGQ